MSTDPMNNLDMAGSFDQDYGLTNVSIPIPDTKHATLVEKAQKQAWQI